MKMNCMNCLMIIQGIIALIFVLFRRTNKFFLTTTFYFHKESERERERETERETERDRERERER